VSQRECGKGGVRGWSLSIDSRSPKFRGHQVRHVSTGTYDFVARFGVLEFIYNSFYQKNAFAGRLLVRPGASGHMLVQHYLYPMFDKGNTFLDSRYTLDDLHRTGATGPIKDDPKAEAKSKKKVREVSRLAGYLGGNKQK
jgi:hypothetical protein